MARGHAGREDQAGLRPVGRGTLPVTVKVLTVAESGLMVNERDDDVAEKPSESVTTNVSPDVAAAASGVPVIVPVAAFNVAHEGNVPAPTAQWE